MCVGLVLISSTSLSPVSKVLHSLFSQSSGPSMCWSLTANEGYKASLVAPICIQALLTIATVSKIHAQGAVSVHYWHGIEFCEFWSTVTLYQGKIETRDCFVIKIINHCYQVLQSKMKELLFSFENVFHLSSRNLSKLQFDLSLIIKPWE